MSSDKSFMHPNARAALEAAEKAANLSPKIVQTEGSAAQSKGTHSSDGHYTMSDGKQHSYCCAIDWSVNQPATRLSDGKKVIMDATHAKWWLYNAAAHGFVAWLRTRNEGFDAPHIHGIYVGASMKMMLQRQVKDYLAGRTGLASHGVETFWTAPPELDAALKKLFDEHN